MGGCWSEDSSFQWEDEWVPGAQWTARSLQLTTLCRTQTSHFLSTHTEVTPRGDGGGRETLLRNHAPQTRTRTEPARSVSASRPSSKVHLEFTPPQSESLGAAVTADGARRAPSREKKGSKKCAFTSVRICSEGKTENMMQKSTKTRMSAGR